MMASFWERAGERTGYALAAMLLGPYAAALRRERRVLRRAFHDWLDELGAERLSPRAKGQARRSGALRGAAPIPFEAELDVIDKRARIDVALSLGKDVTAQIWKAEKIHIETSALDAEAKKVVAAEIESSALGALDTFALDLRRDGVVVLLNAPREREAWIAIEKALAVLVETWTQRWTTYR